MSCSTKQGCAYFFRNRANWNIEQFFHIEQSIDTRIESPHFLIKDNIFSIPLFFTLYPAGSTVISKGIFEVLLCTSTSVEISFDVRFGFFSGEKEIWNTDWEKCMFPAVTHLRRSELKSRRPKFRDLHIFCELREQNDSAAKFVWRRIEWGAKNEPDEKITYVDASTQTEAKIGTKRRKFDYKPCSEASSQTETEIGVKNLQHDLEGSLVSGIISDLTLRVQGKKFRVHKSILAARSTVFWHMMIFETEQMATGIVDINDTDPNTFRDFLHYLYTGNVEYVTPENSVNLYKIADKYQMHDLKIVSAECLLQNINNDNFCDICTLSLLCNVKKLKDACNQFFVKNALKIISTLKWQVFQIQYPTSACELFIQKLNQNESTCFVDQCDIQEFL